VTSKPHIIALFPLLQIDVIGQSKED